MQGSQVTEWILLCVTSLLKSYPTGPSGEQLGKVAEIASMFFFFLLLKIFVLRVLDTRCACTCVYVCVRRNACEHVWRGTIVHLFVCLPAHICAYLILASLPSSRPCFFVVFNDAYHSSYCSCNYDSAPIKTVIVPLFNRCLLLNRRHRIITLYL